MELAEVAGVSAEAARPSFTALFQDHYGRVVRLAYLYCGDASLAEEAAAEAVARVYVRWRAGRVDAVGPYLRQAVVNQVRQMARRRRVAAQAEARQRSDLRGVPDAAGHHADRDALLRALQRLPERQRLAVVLRYYEELTEAETAAVMGISIGGVKSQTSRGIDRLRVLLDVGEDQR